jgi:hypothetical protein
VGADRIELGHMLAALGAAIAVRALWLPWYEIRVEAIFSSPEFSGVLTQLPASLQSLAADVRALIPGNLQGSGWQVMEKSDVAFAVAGAAVLILFMAVAALGADGRSAAQVMALTGMIGLALVVYKFFKPPLPDAYCAVRQGLWVAGAGWCVCVAGGLMAAIQRPLSVNSLDFRLEPAEPVAAEAVNSVPPPTARLF